MIKVSNKFIYEKYVLIKQTNFIGNTYFANYIEWQGEARERFFLECEAAMSFVQAHPEIIMVTHSLEHKYISNTYFGDKVRIELTTKNVLPSSFVINFNMFNARNNASVGVGSQKICFFNRNENRPCKVPAVILQLAASVSNDQAK